MAGNIYEEERLVREYLLFHYGDPDEVLPWKHGPRDALGFAARCVRELLNSSAVGRDARALDVGCAAGTSLLAPSCPPAPVARDSRVRVRKTAQS